MFYLVVVFPFSLSLALRPEYLLSLKYISSFCFSSTGTDFCGVSIDCSLTWTSSHFFLSLFLSLFPLPSYTESSLCNISWKAVFLCCLMVLFLSQGFFSFNFWKIFLSAIPWCCELFFVLSLSSSSCESPLCFLDLNCLLMTCSSHTYPFFFFYLL